MFTPELLKALAKLPREEWVRAENMIRCNLEMPLLPAVYVKAPHTPVPKLPPALRLVKF